MNDQESGGGNESGSGTGIADTKVSSKKRDNKAGAASSSVLLQNDRHQPGKAP
jgi:hypothetical protein